MIATLASRFDIEIGDVLHGGTASLVCEAVRSDGQRCVLKVPMVLEYGGSGDVGGVGDAFERSLLVHQLADGNGCARLLAHDREIPAMLLERLGPNLDALGMPVPEIMTTVAVTLRTFWRPVNEDCDLPTGAQQAQWLARYITSTWDALGKPCGRDVIDRALAYCDERAAAFDATNAVLVHGDAHGWNTLAAGGGAYKFVDPEGLRSERAHDLSVPMREYNDPLLDGDTARLVHARAELLADACDVDPEAVWQWGFIERVSTGLTNARDFEGDDAASFLEVARRCL